jgi:uncharacterized DUF497 family protein
MQGEAFEWDDTKAAIDWCKHFVTFEMARDVFEDLFSVEGDDGGYHDAEQRTLTMGMVENRLLVVCHTTRNGRIRIVSVRPAEPYARRTYHNANKT